ncbi:unnamed protein product [Psylliodes chrysocephalus]|uniref:LDLR chaperone boca n=1 Tax=Psylliodes chrysocephalus TaxID=3402493 RepID=A0A9P0G748_9CUCU|nr:unnamed protein product [Psylliodes chrysocephala]
MSNILILFIIVLASPQILSKKFQDDQKPEWAKKDIRDYNEADLERLLDQWEEDEEPLEPDELPEHLRPMPQLNLNQIDPNNPEAIVQASKKGRSLMTFVQVGGNPSRDETEELTKLWQTSLWNNHIQIERYLVDDNRAIFLYKDGSQAWVAKDYLVEQEKCESVTIESKVYPGKHSKNIKEDL